MSKAQMTGSEKRAAAAAKAERAMVRAAKAKAASFADLFRTDFEVHYVNEAGEARVRECRDAQGAAFEVRDLAAHGIAATIVDVRKGRA